MSIFARRMLREASASEQVCCSPNVLRHALNWAPKAAGQEMLHKAAPGAGAETIFCASSDTTVAYLGRPR